MSTAPERHLTKRDVVAISTVVSLPFAGALLLYAVSLESLIKLVAAGAFASVMALAMFAHPAFGILAGVFYVYSGLSFYAPPFVAYGIILIVLLAACLRLLRGESLQLRTPFFIWSVAFFALFALQSMLFSYNISYSMQSLFAFVKVVVFAFLIAQFIRTPKQLDTFAIVVFAGALCSIVLGLINLRFGLQSNLNVMGGVNLLRFTGTFRDPNVLAMSLMSALPLGLYAVRRSGGWTFRLGAILGLAALLAAAFATYSRAAFFPLAFILLAVLLKETRHRKSAVSLLLVLAVVAVVLLVPGFYWDRLMSLGDISEVSQSDWSLYLRLKAAKVALAMFAEHPFTGVGLGNFIVRSGSELFVRIVVHNLYLEILAGTGILGFLSLMLVFWSGIRECLKGIRARRRAALEGMHALSFYMLLSFVSSLIAGLFLSTPFSYSIWTPLAGGLVVGAMASRDADASVS
ncbi:MAG: O-antigen ligase family protein [Chitinivibrionia bacterium]|nr:O-antigen ligase family protein [Chitinivibrionia bacterium]